MVQNCIWFKEESSQFSMGQTAQTLTCSILGKPHTGLDECSRILLSCFRARNSAPFPSPHYHCTAYIVYSIPLFMHACTDPLPFLALPFAVPAAIYLDISFSRQASGRAGIPVQFTIPTTKMGKGTDSVRCALPLSPPAIRRCVRPKVQSFPSHRW